MTVRPTGPGRSSNGGHGGRSVSALILRHERNRGKGAAVRTALRAATGSHVVIQDGDLEYDPRDLANLLAECQRDGYDGCVYGSRILSRGGSSFAARGHLLGNRVLTWLCNRMSRGSLNLTDMATCYKLVPRELLLNRVKLVEEGFGFDPEVTLKIAALGVPIKEVPVSYSGRQTDEGKKIRWRDGWLYLRCLWRYRVRSSCALSATRAQRRGFRVQDRQRVAAKSPTT